MPVFSDVNTDIILVVGWAKKPLSHAFWIALGVSKGKEED